MSSTLKQILSLCALSLILIIPILTNIPLVFDINYDVNIIAEDSNINTSKVSVKIHINNNWTDAKIAGICTGEGIDSNPYIIENLEINAQSLGSCIIIENSIEPFIIRNCSLKNSGPEVEDSGIKLIYANNGKIINNTMTDNRNGVSIHFCENSLISNNTCDNYCDLRSLYSENALIYLNSFKSETINAYLRNTTFSCKSPRKFIYIYNGSTFINYLGNYWSGYPDDDINGDGIGDYIHKFYDSTVLNVDYYPLINLVNNFQIIGISEESNGIIPGYQLHLLLGIFAIASIIIFKRKCVCSISKN